MNEIGYTSLDDNLTSLLFNEDDSNNNMNFVKHNISSNSHSKGIILTPKQCSEFNTSYDISVPNANIDTSNTKCFKKMILTQIEIINLPYTFDNSNDNVPYNSILTEEDDSTYYSFKIYLSNDNNLSFMTYKVFSARNITN